MLSILTLLGLFCWRLGLGHPRADLEPEFIGPPGNVTVTEGTDALLSCVVDNLGFYRVAWIRVESQTILSIHTHVITRNYRITLHHKNRQHWDLQISNVEESDRGQYMCQINTVPMKKKIIFLQVLGPHSHILMPPKFTDRGENVEVLAREGTNVTLSCRVRGYPSPGITWQREDGRHLLDKKESIQSDDLTIIKVSRLHMGMYLCSATSSYSDKYRPPETVTRGVMLQVLFPPMIWIPNQLAYASAGDTVTLDCYTEAFPMSINYWTKSDSCMVIPDERFAVTLSDNVYKVSMKLVISDVRVEDFGNYKCVARNSLGSTEGVIRLYENRPLANKSNKKFQERNEIEKTEFRYQEKIELGVRERNANVNYELMQNRNLEESSLPKTVQLQRQHISDYLMTLKSGAIAIITQAKMHIISTIKILCVFKMLMWLHSVI